MNRYIDAELIEKYISREEHNTPDEKWRPESEFAALVDNIPTADVVEVVRCKDCACFDRQRFSGDKGYCKRFRGGRNEMNYCDFGYREEVE